jgi:hypothetical protein
MVGKGWGNIWGERERYIYIYMGKKVGKIVG